MPVWKKIRDVCKGADAVKAAGNEYLPFLDPSDKSARNKKRNADYIQRAVFYAITGNTKVGLLGLAFRKDPTMTAPDKLNYLRDNADGAGASIYQQSQQVTENILEAAREGLYITAPREQPFPACRRGGNGFHLLTAGMSTALSLPTARRRRWRAWLMVPLMSHGRDSPPGR